MHRPFALIKKKKSINDMEKLELRLRAEAAGCALTQQVHARCTATQRGWDGMSAYEGERATGLGGRWWVEEGGEMKGVEGEERKELNARRGRGHTTGEGHEVGTRRVQRFTRTGREREMHRETERRREGRRRGKSATHRTERWCILGRLPCQFFSPRIHGANICLRFMKSRGQVI